MKLTPWFLSLLALVIAPVLAQSVTNVRVVSSPRASARATVAVQLLREEIQKRGGSAVDAGGALVVVARREEVANLLPEAQRRRWRRWVQSAPPIHAEAYSVLSLDDTLIVAGGHERRSSVCRRCF